VAQVKLILREDVEKLGNAGDVVSVKPGYARNFLLPQGKASLATEARINELEHHRRIIREEQMKLLKDLEAVRSKVESELIEVEVQAGAEGRLFGSVTMQQVADLLAEKGLEIDRRKMHVDEPIKTVGEHAVQVRLHREMVATLKVNVVASGIAAPVEDEEEEEVVFSGGSDGD
jgi:large subunit ribosomal protein L9